MNGIDLHTPELQEGDVLQIRFETVKGDVHGNQSAERNNDLPWTEAAAFYQKGTAVLLSGVRTELCAGVTVHIP